MTGAVYELTCGICTTCYKPPPASLVLSNFPSKGPYFGLGGASITVMSVTLLKSGSVSGALRANMRRMSLCKYTRPDLEQRNLRGGNRNRSDIHVNVHLFGFFPLYTCRYTPSYNVHVYVYMNQVIFL